jgi:hypothetical protein
MVGGWLIREGQGGCLALAVLSCGRCEMEKIAEGRWIWRNVEVVHQ